MTTSVIIQPLSKSYKQYFRDTNLILIINSQGQWENNL